MSADSLSREEILDLIWDASELEYGEAQVRAMEQAAGAAERRGDEDLIHSASLSLCAAATFGGHPEIALASFGRCAALSQKDPKMFPEMSERDLLSWGVDLIWASKWVVDSLVDYPTISRARIESSLADVRERFERNGVSPRPVLSAEARIAYELGDGLSLASEKMSAFRNAPRDRYADCAACETHSLVEFEVWRGDAAAALREAEPILSGRRRCAELPALTYVDLLECLRSLRQLDVAAGYLESAYEHMQGNPDYVSPIADCVRHLVIVGELDQAALMLRRVTVWLKGLRSPARKLDVLRAARFLGQEMLATGAEFSFAGMEGQAALAHLDDEVRTLSSAFDRRNGNDWVSSRSESYPEMHPT